MRPIQLFALLVIPALASISLAQAQAGDPALQLPLRAQPPIVFGSPDWDHSPLNSPASKAARTALDKPLAKFSLNQLPLGEALAALAKDAGLNIEVNWPALAAAGIDRSPRVTIDRQQSSPAKILGILLQQAAPDAHLRFLVDDGTVVVSTADDLQSTRYQVTVAYDMSCLFADVESQSEKADDIRQLIQDTLQSTIATDTWRDNGGTVGMLRFLAGQMIVTQTVDTQEQIARFVTTLQSSTLLAIRVYDVHDVAPDGKSLSDLVDTIETTCGRDTWRDRHGSSSSIAVLNGKLYINASPAVHQQIDTLLTLMRKK